MSIHPNPDYKLFEFSIEYANGGTDRGLIVASDQETARLQLENESFCVTDVKITIDQPSFVETLLAQYRGIAYFTTEPSCN
jgi:hypothetical protein